VETSGHCCAGHAQSADMVSGVVSYPHEQASIRLSSDCTANMPPRHFPSWSARRTGAESRDQRSILLENRNTGIETGLAKKH